MSWAAHLGYLSVSAAPSGSSVELAWLPHCATSGSPHSVRRSGDSGCSGSKPRTDRCGWPTSASARFPDPLYLDQAEEFAPFGTDEGADTLWVWNMRRPELTKCTTMLWIIKQEDEAGALEDPKSNSPDVDGFIVGAGFALILFTGHIASEGKRLVLDALQRTRSYHTTGKPRELAVMSRDLKRFPATDCTKP